ncbi:D-alanine--D-alanine ligase [candidate division WOR-3 bacterium]|nr:D-alanine--D-alanine ligase [candidate division WOR-3 bacterium]
MIVGVLFGGWSSEREISIRSGGKVASALKNRGYDVIEIDVGRDIAEVLLKNPIDIAYIMLHGKPGEDGTIQGLLETMGIPYTGSGVLASALAINKVFTKKVLQSSGILTPSFMYPISPDVEPFDPPYLIKPISEGSSVGITIVRDRKDHSQAFRNANKYGDVFAERYIEGSEITVGILGDIALPILELVPQNEFYDYEAKYTSGMTEFIIPARLDSEMTKEAMGIALEVHRVIGCEDFSRVDFIVKGQNIYVFEINTIPGMTDLSDIPAEAKEMGIEYDELVERILKFAIKRYKII